MNIDWALAELDRFLSLTQMRRFTLGPRVLNITVRMVTGAKVDCKEVAI